MKKDIVYYVRINGFIDPTMPFSSEEEAMEYIKENDIETSTEIVSWEVVEWEVD